MNRPRLKKARSCTLTLRVTEDVRDRLKVSAKQKGRSMTQELEHRLEGSFEEDARVAKTEEFLSFVRHLISNSELKHQASWDKSHDVWQEVRASLIAELESREPSQDQVACASLEAALLTEQQLAEVLREKGYGRSDRNPASRNSHHEMSDQVIETIDKLVLQQKRTMDTFECLKSKIT